MPAGPARHRWHDLATNQGFALVFNKLGFVKERVGGAIDPPGGSSNEIWVGNAVLRYRRRVHVMAVRG